MMGYDDESYMTIMLFSVHWYSHDKLLFILSLEMICPVICQNTANMT